jgi:hypothetical protein
LEAFDVKLSLAFGRFFLGEIGSPSERHGILRRHARFAGNTPMTRLQEPPKYGVGDGEV